MVERNGGLDEGYNKEGDRSWKGVEGSDISGLLSERNKLDHPELLQLGTRIVAAVEESVREGKSNNQDEGWAKENHYPDIEEFEQKLQECKRINGAIQSSADVGEALKSLWEIAGVLGELQSMESSVNRTTHTDVVKSQLLSLISGEQETQYF